MTTRELAVTFWDKAFLDEHQLPLGQWVNTLVDWTDRNLRWFLDGIAWPVEQLLWLFHDNLLDRLPWPIVIVATIVVGTLVRNFWIGLLSGAGLVVCGFLGEGFWDDTMLTIAMILAAVVICIVLGLPLGIAASRSEAVSARVRPMLDAMQTVHPFVWLVPVITFWGIGRVPGVIATVIFAAPPMVRLTELGIRQVPADVVEAARAYGSTERQLLFDVQLPLARPTIMAGLNQTLLLALSMVVISALLAAGGLGQQVLRGVGNYQLPLAISSGVALLIVGIIIDRLSQRRHSTNTSVLRKVVRTLFPPTPPASGAAGS